MYLTQYDHDRLNEALDHLTVLIQQTSGLIEQEFLEETRKRIMTITMYPVAGKD